MPFALGFQIYPWAERLFDVRRNLFASYGLALAMVILAASLRWFIGDHVGARIPFITFFPAIIIVTLIGGLWPGVLATVLSGLAAWYLFIPPYFSFSLDERGTAQLLLFVIIGSVEVGVIALLNALVERLIIQQRNIRLLLEAAPNGFVLVDGRGTIKLVNESTEKLFGYRREELAGKNVEVLVPERHLGPHQKERESYQEKPTVRLMGLGRDLSGRRKDGSEFPVEIGLNPVGRDGRSAVLATVMDISARKQAEEHQRLVIGELKHRTGNLLAVVRAVINNTLKESATVAEASYALNGRLESLYRAYALLADAAWEGTSLAKVLDAQPILDSKRVFIDGCDIVVLPRAAQQFAMIVHELATNALKYGSLSSPDGHISILGKLDQINSTFVFSWKENGGPPVSPPKRKGFGSVILHDFAERFGTVTMEYEPVGLCYQLLVDLKEIQTPNVIAAMNATAV